MSYKRKNGFQLNILQSVSQRQIYSETPILKPLLNQSIDVCVRVCVCLRECIHIHFPNQNWQNHHHICINNPECRCQWTFLEWRILKNCSWVHHEKQSENEDIFPLTKLKRMKNPVISKNTLIRITGCQPLWIIEK